MPSEIDFYRARFEEVGFVQVPDFVEFEALRSLYVDLLASSRSKFRIFWQPERPDLNRQKTGNSIKRVYLVPESDGGGIRDDEWCHRQELLNLGFGRIAQEIQPFVNAIAGSCSYSRSSFFLFEEHDYLGLHNDAKAGDRVNALLPMSINTVGGIRILINERLKMFYDLPGGLNILGPRVWHDVPPIHRFPAQADPVRLNLLMRYL
ncbi:hypothetical protein [Rhizobium sp. BK376]|uniref:hypothetical protein n=1 Tax=Rhizobium sp. BK376 TaxID=2512149 RepID=UPI00104FB1E9|nr:hypothetical protein [Rhizobium sp. BK376]TCR76741.1 hypothetical protein EV561_1191 [Rhizobium sp. BK376]